MSKERKYKYLSCDFETTVYEGQVNTEVWASAVVELNTEDVHIFHSIDETFAYMKSLNCNLICYYHNLKFDGNFWLSYLMTELHMPTAFEFTNEEQTEGEWIRPSKMVNNTFAYSISDMGQWYAIRIKVNNHMIEIRDSLKLLPFSVKEIGKAFKTKHQKLDMEYVGFRYAGCEITDAEKEYIANDVLVVKEALEIMFEQGHNKLTIGACCLAEYKATKTKADYATLFPDVYDMPINSEAHDADTAGDWIRHAYKGGWCYLVKGKENIKFTRGTTADVNSLYPSMMSSESGNVYPVGNPHFWTGNFIPPEAVGDNKYYFLRIRTRFYIKKGKLPFIQIKGNLLYRGTECLESSDVVNYKTGERSAFYRGLDGEIHDTRVTLTLTCVDFKLFCEHYDVTPDFEILDGCWFFAEKGIFDEYIEKYKQQKLNSKGALRTLAKLFLNNLYGKMAANTNSSFKIAYVKDDGSIGFYTITEYNKKAGYIPVGAAITSYARNFTIRAAQANYYGADKDGFIYADTDSIHCSLPPEQIKGITVHDKNFCCWKLESCWDIGLFVRQKTYIEHVTQEDLQPIEPYYNVKCAGMPERCKDLFIKSMEGYTPTDEDEYTEEQREFLQTKRTIEDFKVGLKITGKLLPKRIKGGVILVDTTYEMLP